MLAGSWWPRPRPFPNALFVRAGFIIFLFLSVAPGFGVQYLAWLVPWVVARGVRPTAIFYLAGALFLLAYYTPAGGGFP